MDINNESDLENHLQNHRTDRDLGDFDLCIQTVIGQQAAIAPHSTAVDSRDESRTYGTLDEATTKDQM